MTTKYMDVHTDDGIYKLILDDDQAIDEEGVYDLIKDLNVSGTIWHGWTPYDDHNDDAAIIVFGVDANIKSVRIYEEANVETRNDVAKADFTPFGLEDYTIQTTFLDNPCTVKLVASAVKDHCFILPYEVNGTPALDAMSTDNLTQLIREEAAVNGWSLCYSKVDIVIPPIPLTRIEAGAYLLRNRDSDSNTRNAKAWKGWYDTDDSED